jgi:RHS repeat-associated protein
MTKTSMLHCGAAALALAASLGSTPAAAQSSPSPFVSAQRYDAVGRVAGTISPDPDGAGPLKYRATRNTYDGAGRLIRQETGTLNAWQSEQVAPVEWTGFTALQTVETQYDALGRKTHERLIAGGAGGAAQRLTQHSYDALGRLECSAVRMNVYAFGTPPASACTLGPEMGHGPDRITKNAYDAAGQLVQVRVGVGTADEAVEVTNAYNLNGQLTTLIDGNGNRAELRYDGHGRQAQWVFPSAARPPAFNPATQATALATAGAVNEDDYEGYGNDPNGNRTTKRLRSGETLTSTYDALNRVTFIDNPNSGSALNDVDHSFTYDLLGRMTRAQDQNGHYVAYEHSGFGEVTKEASLGGAKTMLYDNEGRRTRLNYADGFYVTYDYLRTGEVTHIRENGAQSGPGVLATFSYDDLGRRTYLARGNGASTTYGYDPASSLAYMGHHIPAPSGMFEPFTYFERNSAGQIIGANRPDTLAFTGLVNQSVADTHNGLNQIAMTGGAQAGHDPRGNMTADGTGTTHGYNLVNQLVAKNGVTQLYYDPAGRLTQQWNGGGTLDYVGTQLIAETGGASGNRRYVHGPGVDEPLVMYENSQRRHLHADERGSIVMITDDSSAIVAINRYDEYGVPQGPGGVGTLAGRFGYTGQAWLPEILLYYYKARMYNPDTSRGGGRFMQVDPTGYDAGPNLYVYASIDPISRIDPSGETDIFIGGLDDRRTRTVWKVYDAHRREHPDRRVEYYTYDQVDKITQAISYGSLRDEPLNVIGHSWGAQAAVEAVRGSAAASAVSNIITVDAVSRWGDFSRPRGFTGRWLNIIAKPSNPNLSDIIAMGGGKREEIEGADRNVGIDATHDEFGKLFVNGGGQQQVDFSYDERRRDEMCADSSTFPC